MARYMIPPKMFSLSTLPGAFIIIFVFLMLPFFFGWQLRWEWVEANLTAVIVSVALPSLIAALWIARWVERRQSEEWIDVDGEGVTSTMRTGPESDIPSESESEWQRRQTRTTKVRLNRRRVLWRDVRRVELRSRTSARSFGTHYRVCLITESGTLPIPLNDDVVGTRPMVKVDSRGQPLARRGREKYPGAEVVQEIHKRVGDVPWSVTKESVGEYDRTEEKLTFEGIDDPWSGETIGKPGAGSGKRRQRLILAVGLAIMLSMSVSGLYMYRRARAEAERARAEALREIEAIEQRQAAEKQQEPSPVNQ